MSVANRNWVIMVGLGLLHTVAVTAQLAAPLPPDSEYVVVDENGHLSVNGERQRYWAAIGKVHADNRDSTDALLDRFEALGFNAFRYWIGFRGDSAYVVGDRSRQDQTDYFIAEAKKRGFRIWIAALNGVGTARPEDVTIIDDPDTAEAWAADVTKLPNNARLSTNIANMWDARLEALVIRDMTQIATHRNQYTGLRWCDDPVFAVWELSNEEWWMRKMVGGQWQQMPAFFRNSLLDRWHGFLRDKYGTQDKLAEAWGELLPNENLEAGTILLAPMAGETTPALGLNDANPHATAAVQALAQSYRREDFARTRGEDVIEFFMGLQLSYKQRVAAAIKPLGKSTQLSPMIYDTGIGYEIQSQYLHQNADAVAHNAYINGYGPDLRERLNSTDPNPTEHRQKLARLGDERVAANVGPWVNWLLKPPGIAQGVPWLEHNRVEGKPFLVYETQIQQPAKYRADYPLRMLALASIQDWDWVSWHYFGDGGVDRAAQYPATFDRRMDITTGQHPQGYHYTYDEVQTAMMRAAGLIFRGELLKPASNPTVFIYGRKSLYDPASMDYAGSYGATGMHMLQTVYQHGVRIRIDPTREDDEVIGPVVRFEDRHTHNPYTPTEQIVFDWKKGYLKFDAPSAVAFTGLMANVGDTITFDHGVTLSDVEIHHPEGFADPVTEDEKYIAFALHALDSKPLRESNRVSLSIVSTSFNSGFKMGTDPAPSPYKPPTGTVGGEAPVLVARVAATLTSPAIDGMQYTLFNWRLEPIGSGVIADGRLHVPADQPVFFVVLTRH
jgi:hypothetical protein